MKKISNKISLLLLFFPLMLFVSVEAYADRVPKRFYVNPSTVPDDQVEFWKLIFAKYGKDDYVFHYRDHPNVIYSVLNFSSLREKHGETRKFERERKASVNKEISLIKSALRNLSNGRSPKNKLEKRIKSLFAGLPGGASKYKAALGHKQVRYQVGIKERFAEGLVRSSRYLWAMEKIFKEEGLPPELTRLPLVESSFDYNAYSSVGAAGIWQFMRATGRSYLIVNNSIDERRDPILATRAAAKYLANSYNRLQDWPLAITSYNHGLTGVLRAKKQTGRSDLKSIVKRYKSRSFGFASKNFYSEFAAALEVEQNYQKYFPGLKRERPLKFDEIRLAKATPYKRLIKSVGLSSEKFNDLNPAIMKRVQRGYVPVPRGTIIRLPDQAANRVIASLGHGSKVGLDNGAKMFLAQLEARKKWNKFTPSGSYKVRSGDTLSEIARKHSISTKNLMLANNIRDPRSLSIGKNLLIPDNSTRNYSRSSSKSTYVVRSGDSLYKIARRHGTSVKKLKRLNPRAGQRIYPGQKIKLR